MASVGFNDSDYDAKWSHNTEMNCLSKFNPLTAKCRIYPAQQEYCLCQLLDISGDLCLDYIGTWRQDILSLAYKILKKFDFDQKTPGVVTIFSWRLRG